MAPQDGEVAKKMLGMSLDDAGISSLSVMEVSAKVTKEKPAAPAPRRNRRKKTNGSDGPTGAAEKGELFLKPPPSIVVSHGDARDIERGRSPFSDDNGET